MQNKSRNILVTALLAVAAAFAPTAVQAQTVITSLPYTITTSGTYVLNNNLASTVTSGNLITINASNVTIDFQEHYIAGPSASLSSTSAVGIYAYERSNLTIRNGTVAYCEFGIDISGNGEATTNNVDQQITNMRVTYCSDTGVDIDCAPSSVVSGCQISQIGTTSSTVATGINVDGAGVVVQGCTVSNIIVSSGSAAYGIFSDQGSFTRQCQVSSAYFGVDLGIYQDNLASAVTTAFSGGTDGGGNVDDGTPYSAGAVRPNSMSSKVRGAALVLVWGTDRHAGALWLFCLSLCGGGARLSVSVALVARHLPRPRVAGTAACLGMVAMWRAIFRSSPRVPGDQPNGKRGTLTRVAATRHLEAARGERRGAAQPRRIGGSAPPLVHPNT